MAAGQDSATLRARIGWNLAAAACGMLLAACISRGLAGDHSAYAAALPATDATTPAPGEFDVRLRVLPDELPP